MIDAEVFKIVTMFGTPAQIGMFVLLLVTIVKTWPIIQKNVLDARAHREDRYGERIASLERSVEDCHKEWRQEINGMRQQHYADQLALVRTIIELVPDAPQLRLLEQALQRGERSIQYLGEVIGDANKADVDG